MQEKKETSLRLYLFVVLIAVLQFCYTLIAFSSLFLASQEYVVEYWWLTLAAFAVGFWGFVFAVAWCGNRTPVSKK